MNDLKIISLISCLVITIFIPLSILTAQITRGSMESEIYVNIDWYCDSICYNGLFYSIDNGQNLELKYKYSYSTQSGIPLGEVFCDAQAGILYNKPFYQSDFMISYNYGESWEQLFTTPSNGDFTGGSISGEIYKFGFSSQGYLLRSNNYAQSFDTINSGVKYSFEVGASPGVIYGKSINNDSIFRYSIYTSYDSGISFNELVVLDTLITGLYLQDIYRGANPNEVYLVSFWAPDNYKIFFSNNNGHQWQYRYTTRIVDDWSYSFTPGRENGSFYIARANVDPTMTHTLLYIDYSSDTAKTFTTYFHDLSPEVGLIENSRVFDNIDLLCYPNPTHDLLCIKYLESCITKESNVILVIYNASGYKMDEIIIHPDHGEVRINISSYPSGIYFSILKSDNRKLSVNKFIISM